jgi:hypothetical protein
LRGQTLRGQAQARFNPIEPRSEDCLYLNVWTTAAAGDKRPVRPTRRASGEQSNAFPSIKEQQEWINQSVPYRAKYVRDRMRFPITKEALGRDLERVDDAWDDFQTDRRRDAIYGYLEAVYDLVTW